MLNKYLWHEEQEQQRSPEKFCQSPKTWLSRGCCCGHSPSCQLFRNNNVKSSGPRWTDTGPLTFQECMPLLTAGSEQAFPPRTLSHPQGCQGLGAPSFGNHSSQQPERFCVAAAHGGRTSPALPGLRGASGRTVSGRSGESAVEVFAEPKQ